MNTVHKSFYFLRGDMVTAALALKSMLLIAAFKVDSFTCIVYCVVLYYVLCCIMYHELCVV